MKVNDILEVKGRRVVTIVASTSIFDAMLVFAANRIGSLLVIDKNENILGIICARDVLMATINHYEDIKSVPIDKIMSTDLIVGRKDDDLDYVRAVMTKNRIRHLPIFDNKRIIGLISMGDVVNAQVEEKDVELRYYKDYISDRYPG
ncbi:CBS domain-containing protein [Crocinitomicaceae bacterium]|jgi:predicted transcriptional regulator|nr:CBS domain-containing protein [Crocinitomicaceae bacterium]